MSLHLILFGTAGCHLCEEAENIINITLQETDGTITIKYIDIAVEEIWQKKYAVRIPVLFHANTQHELAWPFVSADIKHFIAVLANEEGICL